MSDIAKLIEEMREAEGLYKEAQRLEGMARRDATAALNRLNDKQKAVKAAFKKIVDEAPQGSDWKQFERRWVEAE